MKDPIIEELHKLREQHARKFNYDLDAIFRDIQERQKKYADRLVRYPPKKLKRAKARP